MLEQNEMFAPFQAFKRAVLALAPLNVQQLHNIIGGSISWSNGSPTAQEILYLYLIILGCLCTRLSVTGYRNVLQKWHHVIIAFLHKLLVFLYW